LIVGILAFTFQFARNRFPVSQNPIFRGTAPPGSLWFREKLFAQSEIAPAAHR
jgi:hypothetical protein